MMRLALFLVLQAYAGYALAYIDPNLGGWLYQMLFPVLIAIIAFWNYLKQIVVRMLQKVFRRPPKDASGTRRQ